MHSRQALGDDRDRCELLVGLGTAQRRAGQPDHKDSLREAGRIALRLADRALLVRVALCRDPIFESLTEVDPDRLAVLDAALDAVGPADSAERALLLAGLAEEIDPRDVARHCAVAAEAIDVARRLGDEPTLLSVLLLALGPLHTPDTFDRRLQETKLALELSERVGDVSARFNAVGARGVVLFEAADFAGSDLCMAESEEIAERTGLPFQLWQIDVLRSCRLLLAGRAPEAEAAATSALETGTRIGFSLAGGTYGVQLLAISREQGRLADIVDLAAQALEDNPTLPSWRGGVTLIYCELERYDEAAAVFDTDYATGFTALPFDVAWMQSTAMYADCAADMGRADAAALLYERLLPYEARVEYLGASTQGSTARYLGRLATLLGRYDDAETHLRNALDLHERMSAPYWIARTQVDLADLYLTRRGESDIEAARDLIQTVQGSAARYGYAGLLPRVDRLLASL